MYFDVFSVKEVNAYYDRKGGRTASISNYANTSNFAALMRQAAARRNAEVSETSAEESALATRSNATAQPDATRTASTAAAHTHRANGKADADSTASALNTAQSNGNICCEQCHETRQLMLQMMTKNLYTQSTLGYPLTGLNAWTAYQSTAGLLGNSLFS